jgi:PelA/Pel-15E family pectate lyase
MFKTKVYFFVIFTLFILQTFAQPKNSNFEYIDTAIFQDNVHHWFNIADKSKLIQPKKNQARYKPNELEAIANNILLYQKNNGGWPKNYDMQAILLKEQIDTLMAAKNDTNTTFDNRTTFSHIECLSRIYYLHKNEQYKIAALKGLDFILQSQYANGGWPQFFPLKKDYSRHITFNDDAMMGVMQLLKSINDNNIEYNYIDPVRKSKLTIAYQKGIHCILKTQINNNNKKTAWCQQHDEFSLNPVWARKFEPPAICNNESVEIVLFLMSIKNPSTEIIQAIENAIQWYQKSKILNTIVKTIQAPKLVTRFTTSYTDKVVVTDSAATPIWTRFYHLETEQPIFCTGTGQVVNSLAEVERERRDGYAWYTYKPQKALKRYKEWKAELQKL